MGQDAGRVPEIAEKERTTAKRENHDQAEFGREQRNHNEILSKR
jgi:hypothetical protein